VPREFAFVPFAGSDAIARGLLTTGQLRGRSWRRLFRDVYIHAAAYQPNDHRMWCDAVAVMLRSKGVVDGLSAAYLWGVDLLPRNASVSISIEPTARVLPHPRLSTTRATMAAGDVTDFAGIPLTAPLRTAFDLGRRLSRTDAVVALDAMARRRLVKLPHLTEYAQKRLGWPGCRQLRQAILLAEPRSESPMETRLRLLLIDAGAPLPTAQHDVHDERGRRIGRVDLAYPHWRIAIEYEGDHHREKAQFRRDVTRLNALRGAGWLVLRFTADDVLRQPARVIQHVAEAINERRRA
jgi:hypothetical protein